MSEPLPPVVIIRDTALSVFEGLHHRAPDEWRAVLDWCRLHGMVPEHMPATQTIVRDVARCRVYYDAFVLDDRGHKQLDQTRATPTYLSARVHAQGETPPMPFPDVILRHLDPPRETA